MVFRQILAGKRSHLAKSVFYGLRFVWSNQVSKIGYIFSAKVLVSLVRAFLSCSFFLASDFLAKSVFGKDFGKSSALVFWLVRLGFQNKVGLVKNCGTCKIKSVKGVVLFLGGVSFCPSSCQQSVHPTLGSLRQSQAVSYALAFFQLDGFAVPRPSAGNAYRWALGHESLHRKE